MPISGNFGNPKGLIERMMLSDMNRGHTSMAKWGFEQFDVPKAGIAVAIGRGGGFFDMRISQKKNMFCVSGTA